MNLRQKQAKIIRIARKIHRITAIILFIFFFIIALTGLLLGWKKNSSGLILAKSHKGTSTDFTKWISLDKLHKNACKIAIDSIDKNFDLTLERIDIRKDKGMIKFIFEQNFIGIQLDGSTGKLLHIENRRADLIEKIHDGSIIDYYFNIKNGIFKLFYTTIMGIALLIFTITGFWLWYGPKQMKKQNLK